ncbi:MAG: DNA polymerase III subunit beta, partial [Paludibacteraceae bacterium]|nr:DNA polymerase III subunit beta [Paludibacteraceae bacterium]
MKFDISSSKLFAQLQMVSSIIAQKNTISILENVIFMVKGSTLTLKAADSETM